MFLTVTYNQCGSFVNVQTKKTQKNIPMQTLSFPIEK